MNAETRTESDRPELHGLEQPAPSFWRKLARALILYVLPMIIVSGGAIGAMRLYQTGPKAMQRDPEGRAVLVQVKTISRCNTNAMIQVMGTVVASQEIVLQPRVSGQIVKLSPAFVPGGHFSEGEFILQIDPKDYELAVEKARSQVAEAEYEVKLEQGHQEIAHREWDLLGMESTASDLDRELALRKPHLIKAGAALTAAQAALKEAGLALERTTIRAPFNCIVTTEAVDLGTQVSLLTQLGKLVGTDEYWVRASVPVDQLRWIRFPDARGEGGTTAIVRQEFGKDNKAQWTGRVARLMGDLEPEGRMARVLISVRNPLGVKSSQTESLPFLIGAYVSVAIMGNEVTDVIALPRTAMRDGDRAWVMNPQDTLDIRELEVVWRNRDTVLVRGGIEAGERLVVSDLPAPVKGMRLTLETEGAADVPADQLTDREGREANNEASK